MTPFAEDSVNSIFKIMGFNADIRLRGRRTAIDLNLSGLISVLAKLGLAAAISMKWPLF